jgi:O-antigen/teichoic acid export membrane protein
LNQLIDAVRQLFRSSLIQSAGVYTITSALNAAIPFLLMPVLTRYLSPADYGMVSMYGVLISFVTPFVGFNVEGAVARQYYEREQVDMTVYVSSCFAILLCSTVAVFIIFNVLAAPLSRFTAVPQQWLWTIVLVCFMQFICRMTLVLWQVRVMPSRYGTFQIIQTILNAGLSVILVVIVGMAWQGPLIGQIVSVFVFAGIALVILFRDGWLKCKVNKQYIRNALNFGIPLVPHTLGGAIIGITDRLFITKMVGLDATGLYTVGYQIGMIIGLLQESFNKAYVPWLYERLKMDDFDIKIRLVKITYLYFIIIISSSLFLAVTAPWFLTFFVGQQFAGSANFVAWIALGYAFNGMYKMVVNYIFYAQKTAILAWITFGTALVNIVLNYIFISLNGAIGAAQATTLTFALSFMATWIFSNKAYPMPWIFKKDDLH